MKVLLHKHRDVLFLFERRSPGNIHDTQITKGIAKVGLETGLPISYGIITADTLEQAIERAGTKAGNKGFDAAVDAIEMANLLKGLA